MKRITLSVDVHQEKPEGLGWTVYSFNKRHESFKHPDEFFDDPEERVLPTEEIAEKLKVGHAFWLSYYEHSGCVWSLQGDGPQCRWDSVHTAGIMIFDDAECGPMGADTLEARAKDAAGFLETYTCWCNGEVYGYRIEDVTKCGHCGHEIVESDPYASCWGYYGNNIENMASEVRDTLNLEEGETVVIEGDAKWLADNHDFGQKNDH